MYSMLACCAFVDGRSWRYRLSAPPFSLPVYLSLLLPSYLSFSFSTPCFCIFFFQSFFLSLCLCFSFSSRTHCACSTLKDMNVVIEKVILYNLFLYMLQMRAMFSESCRHLVAKLRTELKKYEREVEEERRKEEIYTPILHELMNLQSTVGYKSGNYL